MLAMMETVVPLGTIIRAAGTAAAPEDARAGVAVVRAPLSLAS
jgi:hypothetical protein